MAVRKGHEMTQHDPLGARFCRQLAQCLWQADHFGERVLDGARAQCGVQHENIGIPGEARETRVGTVLVGRNDSAESRSVYPEGQRWGSTVRHRVCGDLRAIDGDDLTGLKRCNVDHLDVEVERSAGLHHRLQLWEGTRRAEEPLEKYLRIGEELVR